MPITVFEAIRRNIRAFPGGAADDLFSGEEGFEVVNPGILIGSL